MSWIDLLNWRPLGDVAGWGGLTGAVMAWAALSAIAALRFAPQVWRAWAVERRTRLRQINGGTVARASLEQAVHVTGGLAVCLMCLGAALLAGHRERGAVVVLLPIPLVQLVRAEITARIHAALLRTLASQER